MNSNDFNPSSIGQLNFAEGNGSITVNNYYPEKKENVPRVLTDMPFQPSFLIGRDDAINEVRKLINKHSVVSIHAIGGVGKTALASRIITDVKNESENESIFEHVAWITSTGDLKDDLKRIDVPGIRERAENERFDYVKGFLQNHSVLLVIDNMDEPGNKADLRILNTITGKTKVLITSRVLIRNSEIYYLQVLKPDDAVVLFYRCYLNTSEISIDALRTRSDYSIVQRIVHAASYNALFIELIGKMACYEWSGRIEELWKRLEANIFTAESQGEIDTDHSWYQNLSDDSTLQDQIRKLYDMSGLSVSKQELMIFIAQFPAEMPIFEQMFLWAGFEVRDLKWFTERGWIEKGEGEYLIHSMVKGSVENQGVEFDIWQYGGLIKKLGDNEEYLNRNMDFTEFWKRLTATDIIGVLLFSEIDEKCDAVGFGMPIDPSWTYDIIEKEIEKTYGTIKSALILLLKLCTVHDYIGDYKNAFSLSKGLRKPIAMIFGVFSPEYGVVIDTMSFFLLNENEYETALELNSQALSIAKKLYGEKNDKVRDLLNTRGLICNKLGDYDEAIQYLLESLEFKDTSDESHLLGTAAIYNNLGSAYSAKHDYNNALLYYINSIELLENNQSENHQEIATTYYNISLLYEKLDDYKNAFAYCKKAFKNCEMLLKPEQPLVARIYFRMGMHYYIIDDYQSAESFFVEALSLFEKTLGNNDSETQNAELCLRGLRKKMNDAL